MNIFFDHQTFTQQNYGGISRYFCELITGINQTNQHGAYLSTLWSNNIHLRDYKLHILPYPFPKRYRLLCKSNQVYNYLESKIKKFDIYHATYFDSFLIKSIRPKPVIATFHDMTYERLAHEFVELSSDKLIIAQKKKIAKEASHLISVSESTKRDMIEFMGIPPEKISVIYHGSSFQLVNENSSTTNLINDKPYLLYVGNRPGYKNFITFFKGVAHLLVRYEIDLVCAGGGEFSSSEENLFRILSVRNYVKYKRVDDTIIRDLYSQAIAFIFPSLYEGFGIPVLEAFSCNCPCIISNTSSLPEVAGDAALYIDPRDQESISNAVEKIILDNTLRNDLIRKGQLQLLEFSWKRTVNETLNVYQKLL